MKTRGTKLLLALLALCALPALPLRADTPTNNTFFSPEAVLGADANGYPVYYLSYFDTFTYDPANAAYVYKYDFGWLYDFGGTSTDTPDAYFYDFIESDVLYTSSSDYPYFFSFKLNEWLYYFEGSSPREFYEFSADSPGSYISY